MIGDPPAGGHQLSRTQRNRSLQKKTLFSFSSTSVARCKSEPGELFIFAKKDNIEYGYKNVVPLWAFGLNY
jgi:hypothetical protein